jgi:hypothetical protein
VVGDHSARWGEGRNERGRIDGAGGGGHEG